MDIEKLIEQLKYYGTTYAIGDNLGKEINGSDELMLNAATAISTLQAENEKLRDELEQVHEDNKKLCGAMMTVRRKECPELLSVVYELSYDAILSHEEIQNIARIVFDGLMREDLRLRGQKED